MEIHIYIYIYMERGSANHSSIFAWRIPWTEELGRLQSMELQRVRHNLATTHTYIYCFKIITGNHQTKMAAIHQFRRKHTVDL